MAPVTAILILLNVLFSYKGFKDSSFFYKYEFTLDAVRIYKDYKRLVTSGFLHVNWTHLIFNMLTLYFFGSSLEGGIGSVQFIIIYFAGVAGGNLLSILIHKWGDYSSVGASGAVFSVMFSTIVLFPGMNIGFFLLPFGMPAWVFGVIYMAIAIYGVRSRSGNIGHDAHLGGGLTGMLVAIAMHPQVLWQNTLTIVVVTLPALAFILFIIYNPHALLIDNFFFRKHHHHTLEDKYNISRAQKQSELDRLLEKIHRKGIDSLTKKEKEMLKEYSK